MPPASTPVSKVDDVGKAGKVTVSSRLGDCDGVRVGGVVRYDYRRPNQDRRIYLLLDEDVQLQQPPWLNGEFDQWWYVDVVSTRVEGDTIHVTDRYIDFTVPPNGPGYRVLDLDELGEAIAAGKVTPEQASRALAAAQRFIDRHLHRPRVLPGAWVDFPPAALEPVTDPVTSVDGAAGADTSDR